MSLEEFYNKNYKKLLVIPIVVFVLSIVYLTIFSLNHGDILEKDVSLKGGVSATFYIDKEVGLEEIKSFLEKDLGSSDIFVRNLVGIESAQNGYIVEASGVEADTIKSVLERNLYVELTEENLFIEETGSRLGEGFYREMIFALVIAFVLMGVVVLIIYRSLIPSMAIVFSALFDIVVTVALIDLFGIRISAAGIAALVLIMGYSVDTDILLTTRVLKIREGGIWDRIRGAAKTGLTMSVTTFGAMLVAFIFSTSLVFRQMFLIIALGLVVDVIATYLMNTGILKMYMRRKYNEN
ncbi:MAG: MMPL family transporter [Candidatus Woesearchaeota archaeon]